MDARKRKQVFKPPLPTTQFVSTKFLVLCFCSFVLFIILFRGFSSDPFQPAPIVPKLAVFSLSASNSVQDSTTRHKKGGNGSSGETTVELRVENRVVFTDHILVILSTDEKGLRLQQRIDCVYHRQLDGGYMEESTVTYPMLSVDEYGEDRWIVQCPPPPWNYTVTVSLRGYREDVAGFEWVAGMKESNQTAQKWDILAYDALLDREDTAAVFVKGLHLKSDTESDPSYFSCHFRMGGSLEDQGDGDGLTSKAITASQEIIRCPLPSPDEESRKA